MVSSFAGDGDEGDHFGLSGRDEAVAEGFQDGIVPAGDHGAHEQGACARLCGRRR